MKKRFEYIVLGLLIGFLTTDGWAQRMDSSDFEKLARLEGEWTGKKPDGKTVEISYKLVSNGSALVETLSSEDEPLMVTVYHKNGDKLMMTHYCSAGNQPRMEASILDDGNLNFELLDVTNLQDESDGHMKKMKVVFVDENHFNQVWTWSENGKMMSNTFTYERKTMSGI